MVVVVCLDVRSAKWKGVFEIAHVEKGKSRSWIYYNVYPHSYKDKLHTGVYSFVKMWILQILLNVNRVMQIDAFWHLI